MRLITSLTLALTGTFIVGFTVVAAIFVNNAYQSAQDESLREARMMMAAGVAARMYTDKQITPLLNRLPSSEFYPESVPSFGAHQVIARFNTTFRDFSYRETALNPTNLNDLARSWEADVIMRFRENPGLTEIVGEHETGDGGVLYLAQPFRITNADCLTCHSEPAAAPVAMIKQYGPLNGFHWRMNETIGARFVTVPKSARFTQALASVELFLIAFGTVLLMALLAMLLVIHYTVTVRVHALAGQAEALSTGASHAEELPERGAAEFRRLAASINRLHRSVRLLLVRT